MKALTSWSWSKSPSRHCLLRVDNVNREHRRRAGAAVHNLNHPLSSRTLAAGGTGRSSNSCRHQPTSLAHPAARLIFFRSMALPGSRSQGLPELGVVLEAERGPGDPPHAGQDVGHHLRKGSQNHSRMRKLILANCSKKSVIFCAKQ